MQVSQMGDYDYGSYAVHRTGVAPYSSGPFYNSLPLWSYKPTMTSSPPSSVMMTSAFAAPRRQAMSEVGTTHDVGLQRSETLLTTRSMPHESDSNHSTAWYHKTKQALSAVPAFFEARTNKGNNRDIDRYNRWQPQDMESNSTAAAQFLSLPAKPVSVFQANRSQATSASVPDQSSAFSKPHSTDGLNQRYNPSVPTLSESVTSARYSPSTPAYSALTSTASPTSAMYNGPGLGSSASATSARHNPSASVPQASVPQASVPTANGPSADYRSANGHAANSRAFLKASPTNNKNNALGSSNYATPRSTTELPPPERGNAENTRRPTVESSHPRQPAADPSGIFQKSGLYSKHTGAQQSHPSENSPGHRPHVGLPSLESSSHKNFPSSSSNEFISKETSGNVKFNPLFESHIKDRGPADLSSAFAMAPPPATEVGLNRHLAGQRLPTDGVRLAAKANGRPASAVDEKELVKDAFRFLDDFDE